ncbi:spore coat associated protein CotJA [Clostridium paraputrificum]|uniref:spore coat associated protein CotJA n=1 Tax=Clostridium TaxID=1485 RepID=UPI003D3435A5
MYYERDNECKDCEECINDPSKLYCNIACKNTKKNCYETFKVFDPKVYAKTYIVLQPYECLFTVNEAFASGTLFKNLYSPYCDVKYIDNKEGSL